MSDQKEKWVTGNKNQWQEKISVAKNGHFFSLILQISTCEKSKFQGNFSLSQNDFFFIFLVEMWMFNTCTHMHNVFPNFPLGLCGNVFDHHLGHNEALTIRSHNGYPNEDYSPNYIRLWTITTSQRYIFQIKFNDFQVLLCWSWSHTFNLHHSETSIFNCE